eukprot:Amastigsp_a850368_20.p1 type:complete len:168 gc:universal Amastigsp_a850368_20:36-539(+)
MEEHAGRQRKRPARFVENAADEALPTSPLTPRSPMVSAPAAGKGSEQASAAMDESPGSPAAAAAAGSGPPVTPLEPHSGKVAAASSTAPARARRPKQKSTAPTSVAVAAPAFVDDRFCDGRTRWFDVEIIGTRLLNDVVHHRVHYIGWPDADDEWVAESELAHLQLQ